MKKFTVVNKFHNTEAYFMYVDDMSGQDALDEIYAEAAMGNKQAAYKVKMLEKKLCGIKGCGCSGMNRVI